MSIFSLAVRWLVESIQAMFPFEKLRKSFQNQLILSNQVLLDAFVVDLCVSCCPSLKIVTK